jgi:hypothetical protein
MSNASQREKISLYCVLLVISVCAVFGTLYFIEKLQDQQNELLSTSFSLLKISTIRLSHHLFTITLIKKRSLSKEH